MATKLPYVSDIPSKTSTVIARNIENQIVRDDNGPVIVQQLVALRSKTNIHTSMIKLIKDGGLDGARDEEGNIHITETSMRRRWPNWIVPMTT